MSPDGATHLKLWKQARFVPLGLSIVALLLLYALHNVRVCFDGFCVPLALFFALSILFGYFVLGYFVDPDADVVGITSAEGRMMNKMPIVGSLFVAYWTFYGAIFRTKHRSFWTHSYIFSTFIRFIYGFWWSFWFFRELLGIYVILGCFVGLCLSDAVHIWADRNYGGK